MELADQKQAATDLKLRQDILDELEFDPCVNAAHIGVAVDNDVVILSGHVSNYLEELAVMQAVNRVKGVHAIAQEIEVRLPRHTTIADDEIAARAIDVLRWNSQVPSDSVQITVHQGRVTLTGDVFWHYQRQAAEDDVSKLHGVVEVRNHIEIKTQTQAADVQEKIERALKRSAEVEAKAIHVSVRDGWVLLEGHVRDWKERDAIERAALSAPGIKSVEDRLVIG
jgi:osmotically-inducible protein OsmY